jgi:hypothetical protein
MPLTPNFPDIVTGLGVNGFVGGETARAAQMNTYVLEPLLYLKDPATATFNNDAVGQNVTSTSLVDITGATGTITTTGGRVQVGAMLSVNQNGAAQDVPFTLLIDGVNQGDASNGMLRVRCAANAYTLITFNWFTAALAAGSHTFKLQTRSPNANGLAVAQIHGFFREVS